MQGIGETFQIDEFTGSLSLSIPIHVSRCRGFEPYLSLNYISNSENGIFGNGFSISIPSISRKASSKYPQYKESDTFLISDWGDLVPISNGQREENINSHKYRVISYRPSKEGLFGIVEQWIDLDSNNIYWKVVDRENITSIFGKTEESRIFDPDNPGRIFKWLLTELFDAKGNRIVYEYKSENNQGVPDTPNEVSRSQIANKYIERIRYGNVKPFLGEENHSDLWNFEIVFDYGEHDLSLENHAPYNQINPWKNRQDSFSIYQAGFEIRTHRLCRNILMFHRFEGEDIENPTLVHVTRFHYSESPTISLLTAFESIGYRFPGSGEAKHYEIKKLPPLEFNYTDFNPSNQIFKPLTGEDDQLILGVDLFPKYMLVDLFGEGIPGILYSDGRSALYWEPKGDGKYSNPQGLCRLPIDANVGGMNYRLMDLTGNGKLDLVISTPFIAGYYEVNPDRTWEGFKPIPSFPIDFNSPGTYWVDAIGHGLLDLLRIENDRILIYPSQGKKGFGAPFYQIKCEDLPWPKQGAVNELVQFADMFGTGSQQLVRITNGLVECWPHLGYGKFGKRVLIANAPYFGGDLDASRLFLADLDGSGTADLIYANSDHVKIYFNQSGNSFSENPLIINLPGVLDRLNQIEFADIYGNGNRCLIFSENHPKTRHWIYDFCQEKKPYLLEKINNNLGAIHTITYCSSGKYYLEDKKNYRPWLFSQPSHVQVVMRTETSDSVSDTNLVRNYFYHHSYYDGIERELCGFGMVERLDADPLSISSNPYDVYPVLTKTWYHTGAGMLTGDISEQYSHEYFRGDALSHTMPNSVFDLCGVEPDDETWHQALMSLKGMVLRKEIYSPDAPTTQPGQDGAAPYIVSEANYLVKLIQKNDVDNYGVFSVHPRETISYNYDRNPKDPRIDHEFILKIDEFGNQIRSCSVAYGRRFAGDEKVQEQTTPKITCQESIFIPLDRIERISTFSSHLPGLLQESRSLEIRDVESKADYFDFREISDIVDGALKACSSSASGTSIKLLSWQRNYYWGSDTSKIPILDGKVSRQALLYRSEEAVFSDNEIKNNIFEGVSKIGDHEDIDSLLVKDGGYCLDKGLWWNPGLKSYYHDADQFFLPHYTADAFGNITTYEYDKFNLLLTKTTDALNNQMTVESIDYQVLQPQKVLDMNKNAYEVLFDPLGMAVVTSQYSTKSDKPEGFMRLKGTYKEQTPGDLKDVIADPQIYLQGAASYLFYDLFSWKRENIPVHAVSLTAERYPTEGPTPIQIQITYSDGLGRVEQVSSKVEPGEAFLVDPDGKITTGYSDDRWLISGKKAYNNKGSAIKQHEPIYASTYGYIGSSEISKFGVSSILYFDPLQRLIRVDTPKGFFRKTEFSTWEERYYDENDTVKDSEFYKKNIDDPAFDVYERAALKKADLFYNTPEKKILDNLGRVVREVQTKEDGAELVTHSEWDMKSNLVSSSDPRLYSLGKKNILTSYSLNGMALLVDSVDAGMHWQLFNAVNNIIYSKDSRGYETVTRYDALHRPVQIHVRGGDGTALLNQTVERMVYGESYGEQGGPEGLNLRGKLHIHYDQAGLIKFDEHDLKGLPIKSSRQLCLDYSQEVNWDDISPDRLSRVLEPAVYTTEREYDALGRVTGITNPDGNICKYACHLSGRLKQIRTHHQLGAEPEVYVQDIEYNARGQRIRMTYGNGVASRYEYEPSTFRLKRIETIRSGDLALLQNLTYSYDPVGNITHIADGSCPLALDPGQEVSPESDYTYDALYRLIATQGREYPSSLPKDNERRGDFDENSFLLLSRSNLDQLLKNYTRHFSYDDAGNLCQMEHQSTEASSSWRQGVTISGASNRAVEEELEGYPEKVDLFFDPNGNRKEMSGIEGLSWDYRDYISEIYVADSEEREYYVYDSGGNRLRKVLEIQDKTKKITPIQETIYLSMMEIKRTIQGEKVVEEYHVQRIMDDQGCIAMNLLWLHGIPPACSDNPLIRYQLKDHLGSSVMEIDDQGQIISYEWYYPYGGTAFIAGNSIKDVDLKRYRYSGKERDGTSGLYYYGSRYYAPWLGIWLSPDQSGPVDGLNLYEFVNGNPILYIDSGGYGKTKAAPAAAAAPPKPPRRSGRIQKRNEDRAAKIVVPSTSIGHFFSGDEFEGVLATRHAVNTEIKRLLKEDVRRNMEIDDPADGAAKVAVKAVKTLAEEKDKSADFMDIVEEIEPKTGKSRTKYTAARITCRDGSAPKVGAADPYAGIDSSIDDRGHLVPEKGVSDTHTSRVNGPGNVIPENWVINQIYKTAFEEYAKDLAKTRRVTTIHVPIYKDPAKSRKAGKPPYSPTYLLRPRLVTHYLVLEGKVISAFTFRNRNRVIKPRPK